MPRAENHSTKDQNVLFTSSCCLISRIDVNQILAVMTGTKDRRVAYRQGSLLAPHSHASSFSGPGSTPQRVSKRSYINSATTSTLSRLSLSIESSQPTRHTSQPSQFTELRTNKAAMSASNPSPIPTTSASQSHAPQQSASSPTSASSSSLIGSERNYPVNPDPSSRPKVISRKSSGTNIVARDDPHIELQEGDETFEPDDARAMSPRRTSEGLEKMSQDSRRQLSQSVLPQLLS